LNILSKILTALLVAILAPDLAFGQKDESRLNIGQIPKKIIISNSLLSKNSTLSKGISYNSKNNYTQFYRDLLISNKSKNVDSKVVTNPAQENGTEKVKVSNIYPNPANDYAYLDYTVNGNFNSANVSFFNLLGKQVSEYPLSKSSEKLKINTSNWESGIYMYQLIIDGKKITTKKLLVRHN
jgi:hypothetical protein